MAFQRKMFHIEECARAAEAVARCTDSFGADSQQDVLDDRQRLRPLMAPTECDRDVLQWARTRIAAAEAYRAELASIHTAIRRTRDEVEAQDVDGFGRERTGRATRELQAIVADTEQATQTILQAAEEIEQSAAMLAAALKRGHEAGLAHEIQQRVLQIFEACNFHDIAGQRAASVMATLKFVDDRLGHLLEIWQNMAPFAPPMPARPNGSECRCLHGPKLPDDPGHSSQEEVDAIFGCA